MSVLFLKISNTALNFFIPNSEKSCRVAWYYSTIFFANVVYFFNQIPWIITLHSIHLLCLSYKSSSLWLIMKLFARYNMDSYMIFFSWRHAIFDAVYDEIKNEHALLLWYWLGQANKSVICFFFINSFFVSNVYINIHSSLK